MGPLDDMRHWPWPLFCADDCYVLLLCKGEDYLGIALDLDGLSFILLIAQVVKSGGSALPCATLPWIWNRDFWDDFWGDFWGDVWARSDPGRCFILATWEFGQGFYEFSLEMHLLNWNG